MKTLNKNRKAYFEYQILDEYIAGIQLTGSEIKPTKGGKCSINESFCFVRDGEIFISGMHIPVEIVNSWSHEPTRDRKLLLNKKEIIKIGEEVAQSGLTMIPLSVNVTKSGLIKVKLGLGKGKKLYDKRNSLREKDLDLDVKRQDKIR